MKQGDRTQLRILEEAKALFYHQGYNNTSIGDIVKKTGLSKGNVTYHFKSKRDILKGIVSLRVNEIQALLKQWDESSDKPKERLEFFCRMLVDEQNDIEKFGCPIGTLTSELAKSEADLYEDAIPMFRAFSTWLEAQYQELGYSEKQAEEQAMSLLAKVQGIATMTLVFKNRLFLTTEIEKLISEL